LFKYHGIALFYAGYYFGELLILLAQRYLLFLGLTCGRIFDRDEGTGCSGGNRCQGHD
jgi:hypothetical protein